MIVETRARIPFFEFGLSLSHRYSTRHIARMIHNPPIDNVPAASSCDKVSLPYDCVCADLGVVHSLCFNFFGNPTTIPAFVEDEFGKSTFVRLVAAITTTSI
jgi:hypothetical protein